jgi:hypothetical protein
MNCNNECPICLTNIATYYTECNHAFCLNCLSRITRCALCRKDLLRTKICREIKNRNTNNDHLWMMQLTEFREIRFPALYSYRELFEITQVIYRHRPIQTYAIDVVIQYNTEPVVIQYNTEPVVIQYNT